MVKKTKRGTTGNAAQYVTRNQALKKLQLPLSQFRRLCILKGIHPREPKKKPHGQHKTYYHVKDINFLLHEPIIKTLREQHSYQRKLRRARARKNEELLHRLQTRAPTYRLDHLVRERYPAFVDALRDLADPLTLVHLFAVLPADHRHDISPKLVLRARQLALEWQAYVVRSHALRKVFVSVKGYYYQADVQGQAVTWLVPHATGQVLPEDVDYRVMLTFLEFYVVMLAFVNYKLFHAVGCRYPPPTDAHLDKAAAGMHDMDARSWCTTRISAGFSALLLDDQEGAAAEPLSAESEASGGLFKGLVFFLGREVPREQLLFVIRSFGGTVGWEGEGSPIDSDSNTITHQVVDRPAIAGERKEGREYVQPQWVFDSANFRVLAPCPPYAPGAKPPPHVSPFVDDVEEGYVPDYAQELRRLHDAQVGGADGATVEGEEDGQPSMLLLQPAQMERQYHEELAKEVQAMGDEGVDEGAGAAGEGPLQPAELQAAREDEDDAEAAKKAAGLLSRKKKRVYDSMEHKASLKKSRVEKLRARKQQVG